MAHVALFAADGTPIGTRDVDLPPLGMTQISRVASALGAATLDTGRIEVSTPTPGGLVAAYAAVIDNFSNDPRAFLPGKSAPSAASSANLLANSGFDHGLDGWTLTTQTIGHGAADARWSARDSRGSSGSGSAGLSADAPGANPSGDGASASLTQCVAVSAGTAYSLRARVSASVWGFLYYPRPGLSARFFGNGDCTGAVLEERGVINQPLNPRDFNGLQWLTETTSFGPAPSGSTSALISLSAGAGGSVHGDGISVLFDDVFFGSAPSAWRQLVPSSARINGTNGSFWTTDLAIVNSDPQDETVYFLGKTLVIPASQLLYFQDVLGWANDVPGSGLPAYRGYGPLDITSTSPGVSVQSQTSTPLQTGGSVGESLPAASMDDLIGATPKNLAPIRESGSFRTNLVLVNATTAQLTVHVELFDANGTSLGLTDNPLLPLEMKQFNQVAGSFGIWNLDTGRIAVSTSTPGGLVAAYASVIDNVTNDPRTILPR